MKIKSLHGLIFLGLINSSILIAQNADTKKADSSSEDGAATGKTSIDPEMVKPKSSYALGYRAGNEFAQNYGRLGLKADDLNQKNFMDGFIAAFRGEQPSQPEEEIGAAMQALGETIEAREEKVAAENLKESKAFLEANAKKEGVETTSSGLQYQVLEKGEGEKLGTPKEGDPQKQFMVEYRGTTIDGVAFDASPEGESVPMGMNVFDGMKEALVNMPVGAKWRLFIPSELAYGEQRRSIDIGPNQALIFEVKLNEIRDAPAPQRGGLPFPMPQQGR